MLHSTYYHKDTNEDPKTSAVFENLVLLPDNVIWHIIASSCYDNANIPRHPGMMLSYDFWPHWDKTGTDNKNFVEPDFFMRFENFDVVVEAKFRDVKGQYQHQWEQEITAYLNEYSKESKPLFFIAVGGNNDMTAQKVTVRRQHFYINKCTWPSILVNISRYKKELEKIPIFGTGLRRSPFIPVSRGSGKSAASTLGAAIAEMKKNRSILIFPEGTRSVDGNVAEFHRGAFLMAAKADKMLVPVSISGTINILPKKAISLKPGCTVKVHFSAPLDVPNGSRAEMLAFMESLRETIANHIEKI